MSFETKIERIEIKNEADIINARVRTKILAESLGFNYMDQTRIATAVSELARNALEHAGGGQLTIEEVNLQRKRGLQITAEDHGPGIENLDLALKGGYSTKGGLGLGLSGSKRLMDAFQVKTEVGRGTVVTAKKWLSR
ncbi:MAG: anti-sigma regulatory factor [Candidatus Bathyarchaeia archaeon]